MYDASNDIWEQTRAEAIVRISWWVRQPVGSARLRPNKFSNLGERMYAIRPIVRYMALKVKTFLDLAWMGLAPEVRAPGGLVQCVQGAVFIHQNSFTKRRVL